MNLIGLAGLMTLGICLENDEDSISKIKHIEVNSKTKINQEK